MKNLLLTLAITFSLLSCNDTKKETQTTVEDKLSLEGTWEMMGYYNYKDNVVTDSFNRDAGYRQVKMYTSTKVMWSKKVPTDSICDFFLNSLANTLGSFEKSFRLRTTILFFVKPRGLSRMNAICLLTKIVDEISTITIRI